VNSKEILNIVHQTIADTNYIKDDISPKRYMYKIFLRWLLSYAIASGTIFIYQKIGEYLNLYSQTWYFPSVRIMYFLLYGIILILYFANIYYYQRKMSIKEKDFLKFYSLVPCLLIFSKLIIPLSYYINGEVLMSLYKTISLDLLTLIISSSLLSFYFKTKNMKKFLIVNIVIYFIQVIVFSLFFSSANPSSLLIRCFNIMAFLRDNGLFVLLHYSMALIIMKRIVQYVE